MSHDPVNHPSHYTYGGIETIEAIEAWELGFALGNVVKYVSRADKKNGLEDLKKARWYLNREITRREGESELVKYVDQHRAVAAATCPCGENHGG